MAPPRNQHTPFNWYGNVQRQYLPYSIFVSGSHLSSDLAKLNRFIRPFAPEVLADWLHERWKRAYYNPPADNQPLVRAYEKRIWVILNAIADQEIGRCLFKSMNKDNPVWIVPYQGGQGECNALTGQRDSDWTHGVRVQYSPETWDFEQCGQYPGYRPVESLFHELVHASRFSRLGLDKMKKDPLDHNKDYEEFLAVMVSNSFRSEQGAKKFNRNYMDGKLGSQDEVEAYIASERVWVEAIEYFVKDPLIQLVINLPMPFNVFRDIGRLKQIFNLSPAGRAKPFALPA